MTPDIGRTREDRQAVFSRRRERVLAQLDGSVMILPAPPAPGRGARPDPDLYYVSGLTEAEGIAVLAPGAEQGPFLLFVQPRDADAERWSGERLGPARAAERFGADAAFDLDQLETVVGPLLESVKRVHYRLGKHPGADALVRRGLEFARGKGSRTGTGPRAVVDPGAILDDMRLVKDEWELGRIRTAAAVTIDSFRGAVGGIRAGVGEWEIEAALDAGFRIRGARGPAYDTIVGSGANACVLHYTHNDRRMEDGDLVLIDAGAEVDMYAADVTRTFPASGRFSDVQRRVYEWVDRARHAAIGRCAAGSSTVEVHQAARDVIIEALLDLGALSGSVDEIVESKSYQAFFPHQTSHWLGLDVHDVGDYAAGETARSLRPGMVLTIEPGIYFPEGAGDGVVPAELVGIGVRLEDDVHVTEAEPEVLTERLPVAAEEVVELVA